MSKLLDHGPKPLTAAMIGRAMETSGSEYIVDVSNQQLISIPAAAFDKYPLVRSLNLSFNQLTKVENISNLGDLRELRLTSNQISLLNGLEKCKKLEKLFANDNKVESISGLSECKFVKVLRLDTNRITKIEGLDKCLSLEELDLSRNCLESCAGVRSRTLSTLRLSFNNIKSIIPGEVLDAPLLQEIHADNNKISSALGLASLAGSLMFLNLSNNVLPSFSALPNLPNLIELDISHNNIANFDVGKAGKRTALKDCFPKLESLDVSFNRIECPDGDVTSLLSALSGLQELAEVSLAGNPFASVESPIRIKEIVVAILPDIARVDDIDVHPSVKALDTVVKMVANGRPPSRMGAGDPPLVGSSEVVPNLMIRPASARPGSARPSSARPMSASASQRPSSPVAAISAPPLLKEILDVAEIEKQADKLREVLEQAKLNMHSRLDYAARHMGSGPTAARSLATAKREAMDSLSRQAPIRSLRSALQFARDEASEIAAASTTSTIDTAVIPPVSKPAPVRLDEAEEDDDDDALTTPSHADYISDVAQLPSTVSPQSRPPSAAITAERRQLRWQPSATRAQATSLRGVRDLDALLRGIQ